MADEDINTKEDEESIEDSLVTPVEPSKSKKGLGKKEEEILIQALGEDMAARVMEEALISVTKLEDTNRFEVTVDRNESPSTLFYYDDDDILMDGSIEKTSKLSKILKNSVAATGKYSRSDMAQAVGKYLDRFKSIDTGQGRRRTHVVLGEQIRKLTKTLSEVFGFDDPRQLETFMAAWLMKDSTCRLSGIPGTGKTTVIESAAILIANSYGYSSIPRYVMSGSGINYYEQGQNYDVYLNKDTELRRAWDDWRFTPWSRGSDISGSYALDFEFLQKTPDKSSMSPEELHRVLFNCNVKEEVDADGKVLRIITKPLMVNKDTKTTAANKGERQSKGGALYSVDYGEILSGKEEFETDAGGNEGFALREWLMENFYDARLDSPSGMKAIQSEMLQEIGVAKIDYDKRADEVLYGMEIQQITTDDPSGKQVSAYAFEPIPRPVVTQPIKFFNEANRSQSGVEDAILGLIAEKTVEYRGKTFDSPSFVAWMDTNPHQKGNDLAFIDRIDTELFFTTITLGERYAQMSSRYRKGGQPKPQRQLVEMCAKDPNSDEAVRPYRFNDLDTVWDFVGKIPFSPPAAEGVYDGLRDIAMLSVLFTQRYFVRTETTTVLGDALTHELYSSKDIHQSPLMDISKASNDMLLKDPQESFATRFGNKDDSSSPFQAPALFRRVLGFRFTDSLVKLSRAFAFLRGKDYVSREEILDALPYVIGHRLGPARAGEDAEGRTNGLVSNKAFGTLVNEQEMIREFIVHGYLLADTPSFLGDTTPRPAGTDQTMMGAWDAFFSRCQEALRASSNFVDFEAAVLDPVKKEVMGVEGAVIVGYTPVHWHLASMVVENERKGVTVLADYGEHGNYRKMYENYLRLMDRPTDAEISTTAALTLDYSIHDYYALRGEIAREPYLFTDDRCRLLRLVESRINTIAKGAYSNIAAPPPTASRFAVATATQFPNDGNKFRIIPSPTSFTLRTYGDSLGAYGYLISKGSADIDAQSLSMNNAKYNLNVANWADQTMVLSGYYPFSGTDVTQNPTKDDLQKSNLFRQMNGLDDVMGGNTGAGIQFFGDDEKAFENIADIGQFIMKCQNTIVSAMGGDAASIAAINQGILMACFELDHAPNSLGAEELKRLGVKDMDNDHLRLWLRLRPLGTFSIDSDSCNLIFTIGISSNFLVENKYEEDNGVITQEMGRLASMSDKSVLNKENFGGSPPNQPSMGWDPKGMADAGNMTGQDIAYYQMLYHQVISGE
tara:strand:+ start:9872 stop:13582 length:3711 start_codon:yes stop_codon:yes gene_type:complete